MPSLSYSNCRQFDFLVPAQGTNHFYVLHYDHSNYCFDLQLIHTQFQFEWNLDIEHLEKKKKYEQTFDGKSVSQAWTFHPTRHPTIECTISWLLRRANITAQQAHQWGVRLSDVESGPRLFQRFAALPSLGAGGR